MKEIIATACNVNLAVHQETRKLMPQIELVLVSSEPQWRYDAGGVIRPMRETQTYRVHLTPDAARHMAGGLLEYANAAEGELAKYVKEETTTEEKV